MQCVMNLFGAHLKILFAASQHADAVPLSSILSVCGKDAYMENAN